MLLHVSQSGLNQCLKASSNAIKVVQVASSVTTFYNTEPSNAIPDDRKYPSSYSNKEINNKFIAKSNIVNSIQKRLAHTDISIPDFSYYRKKTSKDPNNSSSEKLNEKKNFAYLTTVSLGIGSTIFAKTAIRDVIGFLKPSQDILFSSKAEIDLSQIPLGTNIVVKWQEKPLFIKHRTPEEIEREKTTNVSELRDPQHDSERTKNPEWLIVLGICTHLGCIPIYGAGDFPGGYFCPCHGSHYDGSGRVRKGPAPSNLEIPDYVIDGNLLIVG